MTALAAAAPGTPARHQVELVHHLKMLRSHLVSAAMCYRELGLEADATAMHRLVDGIDARLRTATPLTSCWQCLRWSDGEDHGLPPLETKGETCTKCNERAARLLAFVFRPRAAQ